MKYIFIILLIAFVLPPADARGEMTQEKSLKILGSFKQYSDLHNFLKRDIYEEDYDFLVKNASKVGIDLNKPVILKRQGSKIWVQGVHSPLVLNPKTGSITYRNKEFKLDPDKTLRVQIAEVQRAVRAMGQTSMWPAVLPFAEAADSLDGAIAHNTIVVMKYNKLMVTNPTAEVRARYDAELRRALFMHRQVSGMECRGFDKNGGQKSITIAYRDGKSILVIYQKANGEVCEKIQKMNESPTETCRKDYPLEDRFGAYCRMSDDEKRLFFHELNQLQSRTIPPSGAIQ